MVTSALVDGSAERFLRGLIEVIGAAIGSLLRWV